MKSKQFVTELLVTLIGINAIVFLLLAYLGKLSTNPKDLVFIDFWGRLCVYSLWFVGYALYRKYILTKTILKYLLLTLVILNIPFFLLMGYFDQLSTSAQALPFIDFWGRLTVYSLWFMAYELYRSYMNNTSKTGTSL
jgi:hypothetical protein